MARAAKKVPSLVRIPERDPIRLAALLDAFSGGATTPRIEVPTNFVVDAVAYLRSPHPPLPIPEDILRAWDRVDNACSRVLTALPSQMTEAAEELEREQRDFRSAIFAACRLAARPPA